MDRLPPNDVFATDELSTVKSAAAFLLKVRDGKNLDPVGLPYGPRDLPSPGRPRFYGTNYRGDRA